MRRATLIEGWAALRTMDHRRSGGPREEQHMRRIASLAGFIALIWLALLSIGATGAQAGWSGWAAPAPDGYPTIKDACTSWAWWAGGWLGAYQFVTPAGPPAATAGHF